MFQLSSQILALDMEMVSSREAKRKIHEKLAELFDANSADNQRYFNRLRELEVGEEAIRPATREEMEVRKRRLAARRRAQPPTAS